MGDFSCADPEIFVRGGGGGGVQVSLTKKSSDNVFFLVLSVKWSISKKSIIYQGSRGGPTFSRGGSNFFQGGGGSNCLFPIETHITCDFPGGSGPPVPPSGSALAFRAKNCIENIIITIF